MDYAAARWDRAHSGGPILLGGKTYGKGLGVHAFSTITVPLNGIYNRFSAVIGPDQYHGTVVFKVLLDGTEVFNSGIMRTQSTQFVNITITGKKTMTLLVEDGGDGINWDHAIWADAKLFKDVAVYDTNPFRYCAEYYDGVAIVGEMYKTFSEYGTTVRLLLSI